MSFFKKLFGAKAKGEQPKEVKNPLKKEWVPYDIYKEYDKIRNVAHTHIDNLEYKEARHVFKAALAYTKDQIDGVPHDVRTKYTALYKAEYHINIGVLELTTGYCDEAIKHLNTSISILENDLTTDIWCYEQALCYVSLAHLRNDNKYDAAKYAIRLNEIFKKQPKPNIALQDIIVTVLDDSLKYSMNKPYGYKHDNNGDDPAPEPVF